MAIYNAPWEPLRPKADYDDQEFTNSNVTDNATKEWLKVEIIQPVLNLTMALFNVKRVVGALNLSSHGIFDWCDPANEKDGYFGSFVPQTLTKLVWPNTDLVVSFQLVNNPSDGRAAWGTFCHTADVSFRRTSGLVYLNLAWMLEPDGSVTTDLDTIRTNQRIVLHELTHAMVFHPETYHEYIDTMMNEYPTTHINDDDVYTTTRTTPVDETTLPQIDSWTGDPVSTNIYALTSVLPKLA